jgi:hypothetical protein
MTVTTGIAAFRKACFMTTLSSESPLARAVCRNSCRATSRRLARVIRATTPVCSAPSVSAGRIRCSQSPPP